MELKNEDESSEGIKNENDNMIELQQQKTVHDMVTKTVNIGNDELYFCSLWK